MGELMARLMSRKILCGCTLVLMLWCAGAEAESLAKQAPLAIGVQTAGAVPGFASTSLSAYLVQKMGEEPIPAWHFFVETSASVPPDRVVWNFKTLRMVWKGGSHSGFPSQNHAVSYLSAEVKLYLNDVYQATMVVYPSIGDVDENQELADMARQVARAFYAQSLPGAR